MSDILHTSPVDPVTGRAVLGGRLAISLRRQCSCGNWSGRSTTKNGQDVIRCSECDEWHFNRPLRESGRPTTSTRSNPGIKPKTKVRVLAAHGHSCISCGRSPALHGVVLDIDHIIPVALAKANGIYDELIESEWNLAPMCAECNRGKQDDLNAITVQLMYRVIRLKSLHSAT